MSKSGAEQAVRREDSVKTSLDGLREIEEKRLRDEAEREEQLRLDAEAREHAEEERLRKKEERQRAEEKAASRAQQEAVERAKLLDVESRLQEHTKRLRAEFALEATRIREDAFREAKTRPRKTALIVTVAALLVMCSAAVVAFRETARRRDAEHRLEVATRRVTQFEKELRAERAAHAVTDGLYRRAETESNRRGERLEALEAGARKTGIVWRPPARKSSVTETRSSAPPSFRQKGSIQVDTTQDPLGPLMK